RLWEDRRTTNSFAESNASQRRHPGVPESNARMFGTRSDTIPRSYRYNAPMRTILSIVAASFLFIALVIQAQDDGKAAKGKGGPPKGGGGGGPKNLQVLTAA